MMSSSKNTEASFVPAIMVTGFSATVAQILILRELLVLFYGNELSAGLILAGWLFWNAVGSGLSAKWSAGFAVDAGVVGGFLMLLAVMLPATILFVRAAGLIWAIPPGELPDIAKMLWISFSATGLFCPVSGFLFGICWAGHRREKGRVGKSRPVVIYLGEALGAAAGGLIFYFIFLPHVAGQTAIWLTALLILGVSGWMLRPWRLSGSQKPLRVLWAGLCVCFLTGGAFRSDIERQSRRWQWGPSLLAVTDTAFHNIAAVRKDRQVSVFANGLWLFSVPDLMSSEQAVHPALLQGPYPKKILLIGGGIAGQLSEILKHPGIERVDYLESDPEFIAALDRYLPAGVLEPLSHPAVHLYHQDPAVFIKYSPRRYDVVLMNVGDPINAQMNRFYTREFFALVRGCLTPQGIFSFAVSGGQDMMGPHQARFLASFQKTLVQVFPRVMLFPGDHTRFFAGGGNSELTGDVNLLTRRILERNLKLAYIRADTLTDILSPFRLDYLKSILAEMKPPAVNRDFEPTCYFNSMILWGVQWHPLMEKLLLRLSQLKIRHVWVGLAAGGGLVLVFFWSGPSTRFRWAMAGGVLAVGAAEIVIQMVLLLGFQIVAGFLYRQLALIISFFMGGLALGAGLISAGQSKFLQRPSLARRLFCLIQLPAACFPLALIPALYQFQSAWRFELSPAAIGWVFSGLALAGGMLGGGHFSMAVMVWAGLGEALEKTGGKLYAIDLAGSAGGVLVAVLITLPLFGLIQTLLLTSAVVFISVLALLRHL